MSNAKSVKHEKLKEEWGVLTSILWFHLGSHVLQHPSPFFVTLGSICGTSVPRITFAQPCVSLGSLFQDLARITVPLQVPNFCLNIIGSTGTGGQTKENKKVSET